MFKFRKFKKYHRYNFKNTELFKIFEHHIVGVKVLEKCYLTNVHFQNLIKVIKFYGKKVKPKIKFWFYVNPDFMVTLKPKGLRMGRGKGALAHKIVYVNAGTLIFAASFIISIITLQIIKVCQNKVPAKTKVFVNNLW